MLLGEVEDICMAEGLGCPLRLCRGRKHPGSDLGEIKFTVIVHTIQ